MDDVTFHEVLESFTERCVAALGEMLQHRAHTSADDSLTYDLSRSSPILGRHVSLEQPWLYDELAS